MSGLFKSKKNTTTLEPMLTDEQKQAMSLLQQFGTTGKIGDFQAGEAGDLSGFNFDMTGEEGQGLSLLSQLLTGGQPQGIGTARNTLTGMANTEFNLDDPGNAFASFSRQVNRATQDADNVLNREAAITGNRFGTQISKDKADLAAQQSDILTTRAGELYNQSQDRALSASQGLAQLEGLNEQINQSRIAQAFEIGGIQRDLKNQEANMKYQDWQRARNERLSSISGLESVMNKNVDYGLKSITKKSPSTFMSMLGETSPLVGSYNTHQYGYTTNQSSLSDVSEILMEMIKSKSGGGAK